MKTLTIVAALALALLLGPITGAFRRLIEWYQDWRLKRAFRRLARELARRLREEDEKKGPAHFCVDDCPLDGAGLSSFELEEQDREAEREQEHEQFYALASHSLVAYASHLAERLGPDDGDSSRKPVEV